MRTWDKIQKEAKKIKSKKDPFWLVGEKQILALLAAGKLIEETQKKVIQDFHNGDENYDCNNSLCKAVKEFRNLK